MDEKKNMKSRDGGKSFLAFCPAPLFIGKLLRSLSESHLAEGGGGARLKAQGKAEGARSPTTGATWEPSARGRPRSRRFNPTHLYSRN
ncbi:hypothetical protein BS78_05G159200 [Paspalum vaginatum]|nr:hypothetical protein BS78_05G159200 [Paspalum vaginatum]